mgnify:CR=1 FL=1
MPFNVSAQSILNSINQTLTNLGNTLRNLPNVAKAGSHITPFVSGEQVVPRMGISKPTVKIVSGEQVVPRMGISKPTVKIVSGEQVVPRMGISKPTVQSYGPTSQSASSGAPVASPQQIISQLQQPARVAPQDMANTLGRLQAEVSGLSQSLQGLSRTQAPIPSEQRMASGALPPAPAPRGIPRGEETTGAVPPVAPSLSRIPLSAVLGSIPSTQEAAYVGLPEARRLETRPRRKLEELI